MNFVAKYPAETELAETLSGAPGAAWIIDVEQGLLVGANAAGSAAWGLARDAPESAVVLDSAMPALARLKALAHGAAGIGANETLTFWTRRGALSRSCRVRSIAATTGSRLLLVESTDEARPFAVMARQTATAPRRRIELAREDHRSDPGAGSGLTRSDADTLREIARRIRRDPKPDTSGKPERNKHASDVARDDRAPNKLPLERSGLPGVQPWPTLPASPVPAGSSLGLDSVARARLAHELRTPLAAIASLAEVMTGEHLGPLSNPRYRGYAASIEESARHALAVLERMLVVEDTENTRPELIFAELDLNAEAEGCIASLEALAEKSGARIMAALVGGLPHVIADRRCVRQMLLNLVANSLRHGGTGVRIRVGTGYKLAGEAWLEVEDTGPGLTARQLADIADDRSQAPGTTTGLGLPLTRELAHSNGARLELVSRPGEGTLARIVFSGERIVPV